MFLTYHYKLLPTKKQHRTLEAVLEQQRELYNAALQERMEAFKKFGIVLTLADQSRSLTIIRSEDSEFSDLPANLQRGTLYRLDIAFRRYFKYRDQGAGLPRFKTKGMFRTFSFREFCGISVKKNRVFIKSFPGGVRFNMHRPLPPAPIKTCSFTRKVDGWHIYVVVETPDVEPLQQVRNGVGADVGVKHLLTLSDGRQFKNLRFRRRYKSELAVLDRRRTEALKQHRGYPKPLRVAISRIFEKIGNLRKTYFHQISAQLVREYDLIAVEDLSVIHLYEGKLSDSVGDAAWGRLLGMIAYKASKAGKHKVSVPARGTTQECSRCGEVVPKDLTVRVHDCPHCGLVLDRDHNAGINILKRAVAGPAAGLLAVVMRDVLLRDVKAVELFSRPVANRRPRLRIGRLPTCVSCYRWTQHGVTQCS